MNHEKRTISSIPEITPAQASLGRVQQALIEAQNHAAAGEEELQNQCQIWKLKETAENIQRLSEIRTGITGLLIFLSTVKSSKSSLVARLSELQ